MIARPPARFGLRQLALLPLVFAGAMMFWTLALGLGAFSLMGLGALSGETTVEFVGAIPSATGVEPMPGATATPGATADHITVQIQESAEPEDVNDNAGAGGLAGATD